MRFSVVKPGIYWVTRMAGYLPMTQAGTAGAIQNMRHN